MATQLIQGTTIQIKLTKVRGDVIARHLQAAGLSCDGTLQELVARLSEYNEANIELDDHGVCDNCLASNTDSRLEDCQYCGAHDGQLQLGQLETVADEVKVPRKKKGPHVVQTKPPKPEPVKRPNPTKVPAQAELAKLAEKVLAEPEETAIVPADGEELPEVVASVEDLDAAVVKLAQIRTAAAINHFELGAALFEIYDKKLYLARRNEDGTPTYKSWVNFLDAEIGIVSAQSFKLMHISRQFSREQVEQVGVSKLILIGRLPAPEREPLLAAAPAMPVTEVAAEVARHALPTARAPLTNTSPKARDTSKAVKARLSKAAAEAATVIESRGEITVAMVLGRKEVPLFKHGTSKRAKTLAQIPSGEETLFNGVVVRYRVESTDEGIVLLVERVRIGSEPAADED